MVYAESSLQSLLEELGGLDKIAKLRGDTRVFLDEMRKTHHRDEYARVSQAFISALGKKYGLPEGWYDQG